MYCVKCRRKTETKNVTTFTSKNKTRMKRRQCVICGRTKTQFIKSDATAGSFLITTINKLLFELHLSRYNFTANGTPKEWSMLINRVDNAANYYDLCYSKHSYTKTINDVYDKTMLNELDGIMNPTLKKRTNKSIVGKLIKLSSDSVSL